MPALFFALFIRLINEVVTVPGLSLFRSALLDPAVLMSSSHAFLPDPAAFLRFGQCARCERRSRAPSGFRQNGHGVNCLGRPIFVFVFTARLCHKVCEAVNGWIHLRGFSAERRLLVINPRHLPAGNAGQRAGRRSAPLEFLGGAVCNGHAPTRGSPS